MAEIKMQVGDSTFIVSLDEEGLRKLGEIRAYGPITHQLMTLREDENGNLVEVWETWETWPDQTPREP